MYIFKNVPVFLHIWLIRADHNQAKYKNTSCSQKCNPGTNSISTQSPVFQANPNNTRGGETETERSVASAVRGEEEESQETISETKKKYLQISRTVSRLQNIYKQI